MQDDDNQMSTFARTILNDRYAHTKDDGTKETWAEVARRVSHNVFSAAPSVNSDLPFEVERIIRERKFIPGGRFLAVTGRPLAQTQNCFLLGAEDTREGWADLVSKATMALMTGGGIGVVYSRLRPEGAPLKRTGGYSSGPIALMQAVNDLGRMAKSGGSRRAAIWAGLHWNHPDVWKFIYMKDWPPEIVAMKRRDFNFPAPMDHTNISVILDDEFFYKFNKGDSDAVNLYWAVVRQACKTGDPGFSIDTGDNNEENLRNAPVCADTRVLTKQGYRSVQVCIDQPVTVWTGKQWADNVVFRKTQENAQIVKVNMTGGRSIRCEPSHEFIVERYDVVRGRKKLIGIEHVQAKWLKADDVLHVSFPIENIERTAHTDSYTLGFLYGDGSFTGQSCAEVTLCTAEKRECFKNFTQSWVSSTVEQDRRGYKRVYFKSNDLFVFRNKDEFPEDVYTWNTTQRASFVAGLFDADGNVCADRFNVRLSNNSSTFLRGVARLLESIGILSNVSKNGSSTFGQKQTYQLVVAANSIKRFSEIIPCVRTVLDVPEDYMPYRSSTVKVINVELDGVEDVYCADVKVQEHSFMAEGVIISNCTEATSKDDSDVCTLGSINLARVDSLREMHDIVEMSTAFLLAGTLYSATPYPKVAQVREKNRRIGLGLMGIHEFLLKRGQRYGETSELEPYLLAYEQSTECAHNWCDNWGIARSIKTRSIAPVGTIGIVGETTTGIEPLFCKAYKRRYYDHGTWRAQYVIDPTARKFLHETGNLEDAYDLANDVERRIKFQAYVQQFVDQGISSTINLPSWGSPNNNEDTIKPFGNMLLRHLPNLRGITIYPDGARNGQPLNVVDLNYALSREGEIVTEQSDICDVTKGESCGA